jgi:FkbM family methyltransferase
MRKIIEISDHSIYAPGLQMGGHVLDAGANKGRFGTEAAKKFPITVHFLEANPVLAASLRSQGFCVVECALGAAEGSIAFNIGTNDEASSTRVPDGDAHLVIKEIVSVSMKTMNSVLSEIGVSHLACVKLDIEGEEVDVLRSVGPIARQISPQWTVEFHDDPEFKLRKSGEVDAAIATMTSAGFSVLVRNWPSRTNVLFVDRRVLQLGRLEWLAIKFRYQLFAYFWRKYGRCLWSSKLGFSSVG